MISDKLLHIQALSGMPEEEWLFWAKVDTSGNCWIWRSAINPTGYGAFNWRGKTRKAHRIAYELAYGVSLSSEQHVMHSCDNPACVNPAHLTLGTHLDNVRDKVTKGRQRSLGRGSRLTADDVAIIRERYARGGITQQQLAAEYNVTPNFMSEILRGRAWKDDL
jgi:hypothetical protein